MQVEFLEEGERLVARPQGRMEAADGDSFAAAVEQQLKAATKAVTIDLDQLDFVNFGGIRAILRLARSLTDNQKNLDFPSFYLELSVINALYGAQAGSLSANVVKVLMYLRDAFIGARVVDPANTNNIISDDLTVSQRAEIKAAAARALVGTWGELVA